MVELKYELQGEFLSKLQALADPKLKRQLTDRIVFAWNKEARRVANKIAFEILSIRKKTRSGDLKNSIDGVAGYSKGVPFMKVGVFRATNARKYASVQEYGTQGVNPDSPHGTIYPVKKKFLAYAPDGSPALKGDGSPKYGSARDFPKKLVFIKFHHSRNVVAGLYRKDDLDRRPKPKLKDLQVVYLLLRKTDIRPGYFLRDGLVNAMPKMLEITQKVVQKFFEEKFNG